MTVVVLQTSLLLTIADYDSFAANTTCRTVITWLADYDSECSGLTAITVADLWVKLFDKRRDRIKGSSYDQVGKPIQN